MSNAQAQNGLRAHAPLHITTVVTVKMCSYTAGVEHAPQETSGIPAFVSHVLQTPTKPMKVYRNPASLVLYPQSQVLVLQGASARLVCSGVREFVANVHKVW